MKIVLFRPEIPQNTGNIARTCSLTGARLVLVRPLGFSTANRHLKRAGLDYWNDLDLKEVDDLESNLQSPFFFFSSKASQSYFEAPFEPNSTLIFGSETSGLPDHLRELVLFSRSSDSVRKESETVFQKTLRKCLRKKRM